MEKIRNFCIIAHIDHGKSTLADRFIEITETVQSRDMKHQMLDMMDIERERGITIKLQPVHMKYKGYELNLIDTPGHVDFNYEVSRSLVAVEGALLVVDASQGIQAQTLANLYLALEQNLEIIPVINKIDLPAADVERTSQEIVNLVGCKDEDIIKVSAKNGTNVSAILDTVIEKVPPPKNNPDHDKALIFDSLYDDYRGVVVYIRVFSGQFQKGDKISLMGTGAEAEILEVGYFRPAMMKVDKLTNGEIGYAVTNLKEIESARVGDTMTKTKQQPTPLPGYKEIKPMVFAGIFCKNGDDYPKLRSAIEKIKLNDAALSYLPENSPALGFGFRCGFLGLLHLEVFQERLNREFDLELIITVPAVAYRITKTNNEVEIISSPDRFSEIQNIEKIEEPILDTSIVCPSEYLGPVMQLMQDNHANYINTEYIDQNRVIMHYKLPLAMLLQDLHSQLKSVSSGYASLNYSLAGYQQADIVKLDIMVAEEKVEALSTLVYKDEAYNIGRDIVKKLKDVLPRQQFAVKIQAAVGSKIIAAERLSALRKDVTAKLYGGDVSRKMKLLKKQKKGKEKMAQKGKVEIPTKVFLAVLRKDND